MAKDLVSRSDDWVGRSAERRVVVSADLVDRFAALSGDTSPIHVTTDAAEARGFRDRVAHGLLLGALVSGVIGPDLPGAAGVLQEIKLCFRMPCYVGDEIRISVRVIEFFESVQTMRLSVTLTNSDGAIVATGTVQSGVGSTPRIAAKA